MKAIQRYLSQITYLVKYVAPVMLIILLGGSLKGQMVPASYSAEDLHIRNVESIMVEQNQLDIADTDILDDALRSLCTKNGFRSCYSDAEMSLLLRKVEDEMTASDRDESTGEEFIAAALGEVTASMTPPRVMSDSEIDMMVEQVGSDLEQSYPIHQRTPEILQSTQPHPNPSTNTQSAINTH